jgi:hypothetical protein
MLVQARSHEAIDLCGDQRESHEHATEHGNLELDEKEAQQLGGNQAHIGARSPFKRLHQPVEYV